jgi:hypothetical protein
VVLRDRNGAPHVFLFETFFNRYDAHTLAILQGPRRASVAFGV